MTIKHTLKAYHSSVAWCDGCKKSMDKQEHSFHCPKRGTVSLHSSGFDYCFGCAVKKYQNQRSDKLTPELDIIYNAKYNNITDKNIYKLMNELCNLQSKQLKCMQCLNRKISTNNNEEKKNDNNEIKKLELTQSILHQNINTLQQIINMQKTIIPITQNILSSHCNLLSNWQEWNVTDVIHWICNVDNGIFNEYSTEITKGCTKENVKGRALTYVDEKCLLRWGIYDIEKRNKLITAIKSLVMDTGSRTDTIDTQHEGK